MDLGLEGRVALVAGGSSGIGFGIASALAREGAQVAIAAPFPEQNDAAAAKIGGRGFTYDSSDLESGPRLIDEVESALGPVDVFILNTGGPPTGPDPLAFTPDQWEQAYRQLLQGPMMLMARLLPGMRERGWGRVLAISSSAIKEPLPNIQLSNAHRPGLVAALKVLAWEAAADGVTINALLPGRVGTERLFSAMGSREAAEEDARKVVPAGRLGTVEELAAASVFLCSEPASYITGTTLLVDGGLTRSV
jgi:3-oxoacyl-[acyl-carrier protein] reductase